MMSESLLLQFCYQCDLGSLETTFETMQNRVQWNFEAFLEDLRKKNGLQGQNDNEFQGYIWPFLSAENIWQPSYASNQGRKRIFNMNQSNSEEIWLNWIMNQSTGDIKSPPRLNGSNCSTCFIGNLEMYQWPWIEPPTRTLCLGINVDEWIGQNPIRHYIPLLSPLNWSRQKGIWRGFGPNHLNLIQVIGNPACDEQPTIKMTKQFCGRQINKTIRVLKPLKWKNLENP